MKHTLTTSVIALTLGLSGCSTVDNVWGDLKTSFKGQSSSSEVVEVANDNAPLGDLSDATTASELRPAKMLWGDEGNETKPVKLASLTPEPTVLKLRAAPAVTKRTPRSDSEARELARVKPKPADYLNGIQVYPFKRGAIYQVYAAPEQVTDIALEPGEELISVSAGDTVRWMVGDTNAGSTQGPQAHILVKPLSANISTNLVILTSRRSYYLELHAKSDAYMTGVTWRYADNLLATLRPRSEIMTEAQPTKLTSRNDKSVPSQDMPALDNLDFAYKIKGDKPDWRPVRAFDDGQKVFIQFPLSISRSEAPPLFVKMGGKTSMVNYRVKGRYYIVDRLFDEAELRLGEKKQQVVRIIRDSKS